MPVFTDQTGRQVFLKGMPQRIVSTVPSQTELLYHLGLSEQVVGITGYCVHPPHWRSTKALIGGTKDLQIEKIRSLKPDLIIGNKEENVKEQIEELATEIPVWLSDVRTVKDALKMVADIGQLTQRAKEAEDVLKQLQEGMDQFSPNSQKLKFAYFIWKDPYMLAGCDTFINSMLSLAGFESCLGATNERYPQITLEQLAEKKPEVVLLSSEPYAFNTTDLHQIGDFLEGSLIKIIDGEMLSWYGSRMLYALPYLYSLKTGAVLNHTQL